MRAPLMVVARAAGAGKSTVCQHLAGTIDGVVLLDADILAEDHVAVVSPNHDYPAFWRTLMHLAHEISQNRCAVAYFGITLPEQVLAGGDATRLFASIDILALVCDEDDLRRRIERRQGGDAAAARIGRDGDVDRHRDVVPAGRRRARRPQARRVVGGAGRLSTRPGQGRMTPAAGPLSTTWPPAARTWAWSASPKSSRPSTSRASIESLRPSRVTT